MTRKLGPALPTSLPPSIGPMSPTRPALLLGPTIGMSLTIGLSTLFWVGSAALLGHAVAAPLSLTDQGLLASAIVLVLTAATWRLFFKG